MYVAQHADACFNKFGKTYYEIHKFLDQYQEEYVDYGIAHRRLLHHKLFKTEWIADIIISADKNSKPNLFS